MGTAGPLVLESGGPVFLLFKANLSQTNEYHRGRMKMKLKGNAFLMEWPGYEAWIADFPFS